MWSLVSNFGFMRLAWAQPCPKIRQGWICPILWDCFTVSRPYNHSASHFHGYCTNPSKPLILTCNQRNSNFSYRAREACARTLLVRKNYYWIERKLVLYALMWLSAILWAVFRNATKALTNSMRQKPSPKWTSNSQYIDFIFHSKRT